ncbi:MAG: SpoIID/LytB domain-containing protein [Firmicutes bacterium]|nr:SpoIID/LytB domain-containing protein [Bacillota bacterium]
MNRSQAVLGTAVAILACLGGVGSETAQAQTHTIANTAYPAVIRVAIRSYNNPVGPILYVQTLGFQEYCEDVLPNEWFPTWNTESLKAGAIAVKMYAWYHTLHPVTTDGFTYDVDNTTNFQQFKYLSGHPTTDQAIQETWNTLFVPPSGEIKELDYRAGFPNRENSAFLESGVMAQWGSEYWGRVAKINFLNILNLYYPSYTVRYV